jgi:hypothetical protein
MQLVDLNDSIDGIDGLSNCIEGYVGWNSLHEDVRSGFDFL